MSSGSSGSIVGASLLGSGSACNNVAESPVVQHSLVGSASGGSFLGCLSDLGCLLSNLTSLGEGSVLFAHVVKIINIMG